MYEIIKNVKLNLKKKKLFKLTIYKKKTVTKTY